MFIVLVRYCSHFSLFFFLFCFLSGCEVNPFVKCLTIHEGWVCPWFSIPLSQSNLAESNIVLYSFHLLQCSLLRPWICRHFIFLFVCGRLVFLSGVSESILNICINIQRDSLSLRSTPPPQNHLENRVSYPQTLHTSDTEKKVAFKYLYKYSLYICILGSLSRFGTQKNL